MTDGEIRTAEQRFLALSEGLCASFLAVLEDYRANTCADGFVHEHAAGEFFATVLVTVLRAAPHHLSVQQQLLAYLGQRIELEAACARSSSGHGTSCDTRH